MAHLTDALTSRDLFGVCRGRCLGCSECGRYIKETADYTVSPGQPGRVHPDNDPSITRCSRCGCLAEAHEAVAHEQERELGNDAFALGQYDAAIAHYSRALDSPAGRLDAALWSNRAAAYLAKAWPQQALHDAERALSLRPDDYPKAWGRKGAALLQLGRPAEAAAAYQRGLQLDGGSAGLREGLRQAQDAARRAEWQAAQRQRAQQPQPPGQQQQRQQASAASASRAPAAATPPPAQAGVPGASDGARASSASMPAAAGLDVLAAQPAGAASLLAAWRQLQQQAEEARVQLGELQQQVRQFERLLTAAGLLPNETGEPGAGSSAPPQQQQHQQQRSGVEVGGSSMSKQGGLEAGCSSAKSTTEQEGVLPTAAEAAVGGAGAAAECEEAAAEQPAAPLEQQGSAASSSPGLGGTASGFSFISGGLGGSRGDSAAGSRAGGSHAGSSSSSSRSSSDSDVEEVYSEVPPAAPAPPRKSPAAAGPAPASPALAASAAVGAGAPAGAHAGMPAAAAEAPPAAGEEQSAAPAEASSLHAFAGSFVPVSLSGSSDSAGSFRSRSSSGGGGSSSSSSSLGSVAAAAAVGRRPAVGGSRYSASSASSSASTVSDDEEDSSSTSGGLEAESSGEADWLAKVEAARRQLAGGPGQRVAPPTSAGRRPPKGASQPGSGGSGSGGGLGLAGLQQMCAAAEADSLSADADGVPRAACKRCGSERCTRFRPAAALDEAAAVAALLRGEPGGYGCCARCGCHSSAHETPGELAEREAHLRRQRARQARQAQQAQQAQQAGSAAAAAGAGALPPEPRDERQRRVSAAAERRAAAEAAGEALQESDCDVLTHQRRTACGGCSACPGFKVLFRSSDANDPEVMFFCSLCGCRADQHSVDPRWQAQEAARRAAEAAAAERRAAAAAHGSAAAAAARHAEAEAFAALGLPLGADAKTIARAYKRLALQLHPDKQAQAAASAAGGQAAAEAAERAAAEARERFLRVSAAYKLLTGG